MKLVFVIAAILMAGLGSCTVKAQPSGTLVSPNLVYMTTNPYMGPAGSQPGSWGANTFDVTTSNGGGYSGGNRPAYNSTTGTFMFGYTQAQIAYTYAFSQALQNSGMSILGYNYTWDYINQDFSRGNLSAAVNFVSTTGTSLYSKNYTLGPTTNGWTTMSGTETFTSPGLLASSIANFSLSFSGKDDRFWAGFYGPQVRNPSMTLNYTFDACSSNPLSSPTCPGYAAAYLTQQCTANPLYNPSCSGYAVAYQNQQCTINPLSNPTCAGYAAAYLTQQCSIDPLYSTTCAGYETAYFNQQCSINPLYNTRCDGYAAAYKNQQCTANPLYDTTCPAYAQAYLDAQCIKDSLFSKDCKGYATAYAIKYLITGIDSTAVNQSLSTTAATKANDPANAKVAVNTPSTTINSDGTVSTGISTTGDTNVDKAITSKASTTNATPTAVQLAPTPSAPQQQMVQNEPKGGNKQEDKKDDAPKGTAGNSSPQNTNNTQASSDKPAAPTARQEIQAKREAAAKAEAIEKGKNLAGEMGKASDMEAQKQIQNVVIQAMGFTPGFDAYSKQMIVQQQFYPPYTVYNNQKNIDNRANLRMFGGTDRLHNDMVDSQYKEK